MISTYFRPTPLERRVFKGRKRGVWFPFWGWRTSNGSIAKRPTGSNETELHESRLLATGYRSYAASPTGRVDTRLELLTSGRRMQVTLRLICFINRDPSMFSSSCFCYFFLPWAVSQYSGSTPFSRNLISPCYSFSFLFGSLSFS